MKRTRVPMIFGLFLGFFLILGAARAGAQEPVNEYRIGPKDLLEITVFEMPELSVTVRVSEDGSISFPLVGRVEIGGLTKEEVEKKLASLLFEKNYVKKASVRVFIKEYQSQRVSLIGAVTKPGTYELVGRLTLLQAISQAGGLTDRAAADIFVLRDSPNGLRTRVVINLDDLLNNGNPALDILLQPNDTISVPFDQLFSVYVFGEVRNPGAIQAKTSKKVTLLQALAQAGGPTDSALKTGVVVQRKDPKTGKAVNMTVNINDVIKLRRPDFELREGDIVYVPTSFFSP